VDFDPARGRQTLRFSYARDVETVSEAMSRLEGFVGSR